MERIHSIQRNPITARVRATELKPKAAPAREEVTLVEDTESLIPPTTLLMERVPLPQGLPPNTLNTA